jgi:hypothetical protein
MTYTQQITGLINANTYLKYECGENPALAPILQLMISDNNSKINTLKQQLGGGNG